ncbi:RecB family exonuclease [Akkermansia muciniphila]|uniref:RecB family exonuclease n=1 Tax=Akkermansia muciniphila TaxID=239935 RepID=UPI001BFF6147|nr:PD-(D/E)XK nuclease family protein [Akkermansia muciniphila]
MIAPVTRPISSSSLNPAMALGRDLPSETPSPSAILPDYLSPSSVKSYLSCSLRFFFQKVAQIRKPTTVALHVGKAIHATLQSFNLARWRGEDSSETAMEEAFSTHFLELEKTEGPVDYADEETRQKVRSCAWNTVKAYMDSDEISAQMPLGVEVGLSTTIPGLPVPVRGVIDLVQHDLTAVDYKSAAAKPDAGHAAFDHELQLVTYQMMIEEATGDTPPSLDLIYLVKTKTPQVIRVKTPPADKQRKQRIADLYKIAYEGVTSERFHPQPGMQCSWCQYRKECSGWSRK